MDFYDLQVGDEVATIPYDHLGVDRGPTIYKIVRRTDKTAWAEHGEYDISFRLKDGQIIGKERGRVRRIDDEIRRQAASAQKREELRDVIYNLDKLDELRRDLKPNFVDRLYAALMPFTEEVSHAWRGSTAFSEVDKFVELSKKRRY